MALISFKTSQKPFFNFQHTALTDVIFLLMIFFLLTSSFVFQTDSNLKLADGNQKSRAVRVKITAHKIFLNQKEVSPENFQPALLAVIAQEKIDQLLFTASAQTSLGQLKKYLEIAAETGIQKFSFKVE